MKQAENQPSPQRAESAALRQENKKLRGALNRLLFKIDAEAVHRTPLHPAGHPDHTWDAARNPGYPAELASARSIAKRLSREESEGAQ